jgi:dTDP-4-amino-4,6-dideoxygalactose transaminase
MQVLLDKGVATRRGVMTIHRESAYKLAATAIHLPISEDMQDNSIILPLYVPMSMEDIALIAETFLNLIKDPGQIPVNDDKLQLDLL